MLDSHDPIRDMLHRRRVTSSHEERRMLAAYMFRRREQRKCRGYITTHAIDVVDQRDAPVTGLREHGVAKVHDRGRHISQAPEPFYCALVRSEQTSSA